YLGLGTFETRILSNKFTQIDHGAIEISGNPLPEQAEDIIRQNIISYNYVDHVGGNAIAVRNTLFTTISHNEISNNTGRYPLYVGGWSNIEESLEGGYVVEYNHLHHVQTLSDDSGVITSGGYTYNSVIRNNLIHDVSRGMFNDNVAIWFDNMSSGWIAEDNIYYNLDQGEMKLCAANLVDNLYSKNFKIEPPDVQPEGIILGLPEFKIEQPTITLKESEVEQVETGTFITIKSSIKNTGSTGVQNIDLWINGKVAASNKLAIVKDNSEVIQFNHRFAEPGNYVISVGSSDARFIKVVGEPLSYFSNNIVSSSSIVPEGEQIKVTAAINSLKGQNDLVITVYDNDKKVDQKNIKLNKDTENIISFELQLDAGIHNLRIGNSKTVVVSVYPHKNIDISKIDFAEYCTARAEPHKITIDQKNNKFEIEAAGPDFYHGEDSYAAVYIEKPVKGNFVATIKVTEFSKGSREWRRAGLFVRNDMTKSFDT
ncbi:MAG: right-handed parallel beta-helix repeat-containing protein, partial [Melioribacteraceae bacterium]|nr:right-handed parallel beta-helix repeat-containing protein [Melioribacteraceae bacterium]